MQFRRLAGDLLVEEELLDEVCLMRSDTGEVLVLNATATDIWLLLSDGVDVERAVESLARAYDVPLDDIRPRVRDVLEELCRHGFLVPAAG